MTRSMNRPENSKHRSNGLGVRHNEGSVYKRQPGSPVARSVKLITKGSPAPTQQDCVSMLKKLLPKTSEEEEMSELVLVERTIAYISYLESVLSSQRFLANDQDLSIQSTVDLLQKMAV